MNLEPIEAQALLAAAAAVLTWPGDKHPRHDELAPHLLAAARKMAAAMGHDLDALLADTAQTYYGTRVP